MQKTPGGRGHFVIPHGCSALKQASVAESRQANAADAPRALQTRPCTLLSGADFQQKKPQNCFQ
jgi:hypothetical protein